MPGQENIRTGNNFPSIFYKEPLRINCNEQSQFQELLCATSQVQEGCGTGNPLVSHAEEALEIKQNFDAQLQGKKIELALQKQQHSPCFKPWVQAVLPYANSMGRELDARWYCTTFQMQPDNRITKPTIRPCFNCISVLLQRFVNPFVLTSYPGWQLQE